MLEAFFAFVNCIKNLHKINKTEYKNNREASVSKLVALYSNI